MASAASGKLILYQFQHPKDRNGGNQMSPPCLKLETYLRMAKIEFVEPERMNDLDKMKKGKKGKCPHMTFPDGENVADSEIIIKKLKQVYGDPLDSKLTPEQHAIGRALQRTMDEHLYWIIVYFRWIDERGWVFYKDFFFYGLGSLIKFLAGNHSRSGVKKTLIGQGTARHSVDELIMFAKEDMVAARDIIGSKPFLFGDSPSSYDASVYAALASFYLPAYEHPLKDFIKADPTLKEYVERIHAQYFPEPETAAGTGLGGDKSHEAEKKDQHDDKHEAAPPAAAAAAVVVADATEDKKVETHEEKKEEEPAPQEQEEQQQQQRGDDNEKKDGNEEGEHLLTSNDQM